MDGYMINVHFESGNVETFKYDTLEAMLEGVTRVSQRGVAPLRKDKTTTIEVFLTPMNGYEWGWSKRNTDNE